LFDLSVTDKRTDRSMVGQTSGADFIGPLQGNGGPIIDEYMYENLKVLLTISSTSQHFLTN